MGIRKKKCKASLRTNLYYFWSKNERRFADIVFEQVLCKSFSSSVSLSQEDTEQNARSDAQTPDTEKKRKPSTSEDRNTKRKKSNSDDRNTKKEVSRKSEKSKKKFVRLIGTIKIKNARIVKRKKVVPDRLHRAIRKKLPSSSLNITCCLTFNGFKYSTNRKTPNKFWDYAFCRQPKCPRTYKFVGLKRGNYTTIEIYVVGLNAPCHTLALNYQLRGRQRRKMKARLRHERPSRIHAIQYAVIDKELAKCECNHMFPHSLEVHQRARADELGKDDLDSDDTLDILKRLLLTDTHEHPFIRRYLNPFTIYLGCDEQIDFLKKNPGVILHFDSTGSIIRKPYTLSKRVYLYSGVVVKNHKILPVLQMISNDHRATIIADFLRYFRESWTTARIAWPPFKTIVVDWSWAEINAILSAWNNTDVTGYMIAAYEDVTGGKEIDFVTIHLCYGHFMKMISRYLTQNQITGIKKKVIMEAMTVLFHCKSFEELCRSVTDLCTMLLLERESPQVLVCAERLSRSNAATDKNSGVDDNVYSIDSEDDRSDCDEFHRTDKKKRPMYTSSPFFVKFNALITDLEKTINCDLNSDVKDNEYRCTCFVKYLSNQLLPYAPLWTGLLIKDYDTEHYTNAIAENSFKIVKESVCENQIHLKAGRVIDMLHDYALSKATELDLAQSTQHIKKRKRKGKVKVEEVEVGDNFSCDNEYELPNTYQSYSDDFEIQKERRNHDFQDQIAVIDSSKGCTHTRTRRIDEPDNMESSAFWLRKRTVKADRPAYNTRSTLKKLVSAGTNAIPVGCHDTTNGKTLRYNVNRTVANKDYYFVPAAPRDYCVGIIPKSLTDIHSYRYLWGEDYVTLYGNRWISNIIIDYSFSCALFDTMHSDLFAYLVCEISDKMIGKGELTDMCEDFKVKCINEWTGKSRILLPLNVTGDHFILLYVDLNTKVTYLLDPGAVTGERFHSNCHSNFVKMWKLLFGDKDNFSKGSYAYPYKADGYNCGIFVIHYIQEILKNGTLQIGPVNPKVLRVKLQSDCVVKSVDVQERCLRCGGGENLRNETWVACSSCQRWTHLVCLRHLNKSEEEIRDTFFIYSCDLCSYWVNRRF